MKNVSRELDIYVKKALIKRGFSEKRIFNNRGLLYAAVEETQLYLEKQ